MHATPRELVVAHVVSQQAGCRRRREHHASCGWLPGPLRGVLRRLDDLERAAVGMFGRLRSDEVLHRRGERVGRAALQVRAAERRRTCRCRRAPRSRPAPRRRCAARSRRARRTRPPGSAMVLIEPVASPGGGQVDRVPQQGVAVRTPRTASRSPVVTHRDRNSSGWCRPWTGRTGSAGRRPCGPGVTPLAESVVGLVELEVHVRRAGRLLHPVPEQVQEFVAAVVLQVDAEVLQVALVRRDAAVDDGRNGVSSLVPLPNESSLAPLGCVRLPGLGDVRPVDRRRRRRRP